MPKPQQQADLRAARPPARPGRRRASAAGRRAWRTPHPRRGRSRCPAPGCPASPARPRPRGPDRRRGRRLGAGPRSPARAPATGRPGGGGGGVPAPGSPGTKSTGPVGCAASHRRGGGRRVAPAAAAGAARSPADGRRLDDRDLLRRRLLRASGAAGRLRGPTTCSRVLLARVPGPADGPRPSGTVAVAARGAHPGRRPARLRRTAAAPRVGAREHARRHRRHRHRGAHRPGGRPQRAVAGRAAAPRSASTSGTSSSWATGPDDLRGALDFLAGTGVDLLDHHRRSGPDRRRPHRRGRRRAARAGRRRSTRPSSSGSRAIVERLTARRGWSRRPGGHGGRRPQAGAGARRGRRARTGRHRARASSSRRRRAATGPPVARPAGPAGGAARHVAGRARPPSRSGARSPGAAELRQETVRLWGTLEAQLAVTLRERRARAGRPGDHHLPARRRAGDRHPLRARTPRPPTTGCSTAAAPRGTGTRCSPPGPTLDDLVADALAEPGLTVATAESCTGGLLAGRLTARAGSSAYVLGRDHRLRELGQGAAGRRPGRSCWPSTARSAPRWPSPSPRAPGRASAPTSASASPAIAGPGGGTPDKPVGTVHLCVAGPGRRARRGSLRPARLPDGGAGTIRHDGDAPAARNCCSAAHRPDGRLMIRRPDRSGSWLSVDSEPGPPVIRST